MAQPIQLQQTIEMVRGDTKEWGFAVLDENGAPVTLAGASAYFTGKTRTSYSDASSIFQLVNGSGITIDAGASGTGTIKLSPVHTSAVPDVRTTLVFDFVVKISGNVYTVSRGNLVVYPDVTLS